MAYKLAKVETLNRRQRTMAAIDLWAAVDSIPDLKRELPYPAHGYGRLPIFGYRRLGRIARNAESHGLSAFVIEHNTKHQPRFHAIGMATTQKALMNWAPSTTAGGIELSYWCDPKGGDPRAIGSMVVDKLLEASRLSGTPDYALHWMVTLPDDEIKTDVCQEAGMEPVGQPRRYDIEDGVTEPRQLWARDLT